MSEMAVQVLLLGENVKASSYLLSYLEERGCHCSLATSIEDGLLLFQKYKYRLILSMNSVPQIARMIALLGPSNCSAFYALPVEHGCWWLPLMKGGQVCLGAPALRPREFTSVLNQIVREMRSHYSTAPMRLPEIAYDNVRALKVAS